MDADSEMLCSINIENIKSSEVNIGCQNNLTLNRFRKKSYNNLGKSCSLKINIV